MAVCGRDPDKTGAFAAEKGLRPAGFEEILADRSINYVLNLTPAVAHTAITSACLDAGMSVYSEKPLASTLGEADGLIALAERSGLLLACAPANILWPPIAMARKLVANGDLGQPMGGLATLVYPGPELFHPDPAQFYRPATGPLKDMGVYQVAALAAILGPIVSVAAMADQSIEDRRIIVGPLKGGRFVPEAPTHVAALLRHAGGPISTIIVSFDGLSASAPRLEIFGKQAGLVIENVHRPDATVTRRGAGTAAIEVLDAPPWTPALHAIGPTSAWKAFHTGHPFEVSGARARATLAALLAIEEAALGCSNLAL